MKNPLNRLVVDDEWKSKLLDLVTEHERTRSGDWKKKILKIMKEHEEDKNKLYSLSLSDTAMTHLCCFIFFLFVISNINNATTTTKTTCQTRYVETP